MSDLGNETSPESFLLHNALARKPKRIRTAFSPSQLLRLEHAFEKNHYVVGAERKQLAHSLSLTETQVRDSNGVPVAPHCHLRAPHLHAALVSFPNERAAAVLRCVCFPWRLPFPLRFISSVCFFPPTHILHFCIKKSFSSLIYIFALNVSVKSINRRRCYDKLMWSFANVRNTHLSTQLIIIEPQLFLHTAVHCGGKTHVNSRGTEALGWIESTVIVWA